MALKAIRVPVKLDTEKLNSSIDKAFHQGATDKVLVITITRDGGELPVEAGFNISAKTIFPAVNGKQYSYDIPGNLISIVDGKIEMGIDTNMVSVVGESKLVINIEEGIQAFTYSTTYVVNKTLGQADTDPIGNLPTVKTLETQINKNTVDITKKLDKGSFSGTAESLKSSLDNQAAEISGVKNIVDTHTGTLSDQATKIAGAEQKATVNAADIVTAKADIVANSNNIASNKVLIDQQAVSIPGKVATGGYTGTAKDLDDAIKATAQKVSDTDNAVTALDATKASKDMSDVPSFINIPDGAVLYKEGGVFKDTGMRMINGVLTTTNQIRAASIKVDSDTLYVGNILALHESGALLEVYAATTKKDFTLLDYESDPIKGTKPPTYYKRGEKNYRPNSPARGPIVIVPGDNIVMSDITEIDYGAPSIHSQVQAMYFNFVDDVANLRMCIEVNGAPLSYYPSERAWNGSEPGLDITSGLRPIPLKPFFSFFDFYDIVFRFKADGPINLRGNGTRPYLAVDRNVITILYMAVAEPGKQMSTNDLTDAMVDKINTSAHKFTYDASSGLFIAVDHEGNQLARFTIQGGSGSGLTPEAMVVGLEALDVSKKLSYADGLKGKPTIPEATTDLEDTPKSLAGQRGKILEVNEFEDGYKLVDKPTGGNADLTGLAKKDLSNVLNSDIVKRSGEAGMLQKDLEDVDLAKLYAKGIDAKLGDAVKVKANTDELNRLKTDISGGGLENYAYRGKEMPTIPTDKQYKAYYLTFYSIGDSEPVLNIPANAPEGTIFSVDNNDKNSTMFIAPPTGETINSKDKNFKVNSDSFQFLIKSGSDWLIAFSGYLPRNLATLIESIKSRLSGSLNTIEEIKAQLADRLHTFREIQNEFSAQLHSFDDIDAEMVRRGFSKGFSAGYGVLDSQTAPQDLNWAVGNVAPNEVFIIPSTNQGNKYLAIYVPIYLESLISKILLNNLEIEFTTNKVTVGNLDYVILVSTVEFDTNTNNRVSIGFRTNVSISGIELDDGSTNKAGVTKINLANMELSGVTDGSTEVTLTAKGSAVTFVDGGTKADFIATKVQSMDKSIRIAKIAEGVADLSKGTTDHNEGIHARLGNDQNLNSNIPKSKLYFGDTRVKGGQTVYADMNTKSFVIQDVDPQDDPNISGGTTFVIALYYEPSPFENNIFKQDGSVEIELVDDSDNPILDVEGSPMGAIIDYKAGDKERPELYIGETQAKGFTRVHFKIKPNFPSEELISVGANTQLCIQSITKDESSGLALLSFMSYTGYSIAFDTKYYGDNSMNLSSRLLFPETEKETGVSFEDLGQEMYLDTKSNCKISIQDYHLNIIDDGSTLPIFTLGKYYTALDAKYMGGKNYKVTATLTDNHNAFYVSILRYTGIEDVAPKPVVESYGNSSPVFTTGWALVESMFIPENVVDGDHDVSKDFTLPVDAKALAVVMYVGSSETPLNLKLKDLEGDISPWFNKLIITDNSHISEKYLLGHREVYQSKVLMPSGVAGYRFTAGSADAKVPFGIVSGGDGKIINDNSWQDAGAYDPNKVQGDMKSLVDGTIKMSYEARCYNEGATMSQVEFVLSKVEQDGTFTEVAGSRVTTTIEANRIKPKIITSKDFTFETKKDDTYRVFMRSDKNDGFYIEAKTDGFPLFKSDIYFDEITAVEKDILDKLVKSDEVLFVDGGKPVDDPSKYRLKIDVKSGQTSIQEV